MQLSFDFPQPNAPTPAGAESAYASARHWSSGLAERLGEPVRLVITDNRRTVLSAHRIKGRMQVRLHHMFLDADHGVLEAVAAYVADSSHSASRVIDEYVESNKSRVVASAERRTLIRPEGEVYDLQQLFDALQTKYFSKTLDAKITWGRRSKPKRRQRSLQLGNYIPDEKLIRIHPVLDQPWVPQFVVEGVVYHEMLHHDMPAVVRNGRHQFHTAAFRKREALFERLQEAEVWERENLWRLMRRKR